MSGSGIEGARMLHAACEPSLGDPDSIDPAPDGRAETVVASATAGVNVEAHAKAGKSAAKAARGKAPIRVVHSSPGRVRLKVRRGKRYPEILNAVAESFRGLPGIEQVEAHPVSGSVILFYNPVLRREFLARMERAGAQTDSRLPEPPETDIDKLAKAIRSEAEFLARHSTGARAVVDFCKRLDHGIKAASNHTVDLKLMLAAAVVAATILEVGTTAAPVWVMLLLFGANHVVQLRREAASAHSKGAGVSRAGPSAVQLPS
jgi:hypothetical protein